MSIAFDIGANNGKWGLEYAAAHPTTKVFAFEPTPFLVKQIQAQTLPANYRLVPKAVSDVAGKATFHLTPGEGGCSSLLPIRPPEELAKVWANRPEIVEVDTVEVDVVRLDDFIAAEGLWKEPIEFLHIDAQGVDLKVLQSVGTFLPNVRMGEVEAVIKPQESIYEGQETTVEACCVFLKQHGFRFCPMPHLNFLEADVRFWRLR